MSIKAKQVAGVTTLVVVVVAVLSACHLAHAGAAAAARKRQSRGELLADAIFQRAADVVAHGGEDPYAALRDDGGHPLDPRVEHRATPATSPTRRSSTRTGIAVAHSDRGSEGQPDRRAGGPRRRSSTAARRRSSRAVVFRSHVRDAAADARRRPGRSASIRIGVSTLLVRNELRDGAARARRRPSLVALLVSTLVAMLLAQWMLRPIHVIQSGLTRLGRGELDVGSICRSEEFSDLGSSFDAVSAQLSAVRAEGSSPVSVGDRLRVGRRQPRGRRGAVLPDGELMFCNSAMARCCRARVRPTRRRDAAAGRQSGAAARRARRWRAGSRRGRVSIALGRREADPDEPAERLLMSHAIEDAERPVPGRHARRAQPRVSEPGALDAELLAEAGGARPADGRRRARGEEPAQRDDDSPRAAEAEARAPCREPIAVPAPSGGIAQPRSRRKHVNVIGDEIRRLDQVVIGFLKFARPDELKLQPVQLVDAASATSRRRRRRRRSATA